MLLVVDEQRSIRIELPLKAADGYPFVELVELDQSSGVVELAEIQSCACSLDRHPAGLGADQHARPPRHGTHAPDGKVRTPAEEVRAFVASLERSPVEVLDRLVDSYFPVAVLDDHPPVNDVHLAHAIEIETSLVPELSQHESFVVEALGTQKCDRERHRVDAVRTRTTRPLPRLH